MENGAGVLEQDAYLEDTQNGGHHTDIHTEVGIKLLHN